MPVDAITWRKAVARPAFIRAMASGCLAGLAVVWVLPRFFAWIQAKPGLLLHDPVLTVWGPENVTWATFAVLYGTLLLVISSIARQPMKVMLGLWAYVLMLLMRMACMALLTLEPPPGIIPLIDPFTQLFYPAADPFLKDLFFSGHTATLALMAMLARKGWVRWAAMAATGIIGLLVLVQHVHWTVDVLAAIPASWIAWSAARWLLRATGAVTSSEGA